MRPGGRLGGPRPIAGGASLAAYDARRKRAPSPEAAVRAGVEAATEHAGRAATVELSVAARTLAASSAQAETGGTDREAVVERPSPLLPPAVRARYIARFETAQAGTGQARLIDTSA